MNTQRLFTWMCALGALLLARPAFAVDLWSMHPVQLVSLPRVREEARCRTAVDYFIFERLEKAELEMNPEADRRSLIRRLTLDLHGVPPTPDEVAAFLNDPAPDAYERVVDRLLCSARYGERWGRHWLDVARYTESQGFEYDHLRPNGWHYRDYVIHAFNSDKPYDQFIREQIAGDVIAPDSPEAVIATSFLVCGAYDQAGNAQANATQKAISREDELEDLIGTVGQGVLGLTVNCARCHSHKFDPIPQTDYYRIKSVFEGVRHGEREVASLEQRKAREADVARITESVTDAKARDQAIKALRPLPVSYTGVRQQPQPTKLLKRGDVKSPAEELSPGALAGIEELPSDFGLAANAPEAERRLRFAEWLTDRRNPLTARVIANRIWYYHFGQGIVATPSDFGNGGSRPTHPELLDWLANYLVENRWSLKALHRVIVCSAAYRQSSTFQTGAAAKDAENSLFWRFRPKRLEGEALRDAVLAVSGSMNWQMGGPSFKPFEIVTFNSSSYFPRDSFGAEYDRRTVYRANVNSGKDPLLDTLDCPDPSVKAPKRMVTITPLQALSLMNNPFIERQSEHLAARAMAECGVLERAIDRTYELALGRLPRPEEAGEALEHARKSGLAHVCWVLFNSTEFMYAQ